MDYLGAQSTIFVEGEVQTLLGAVDASTQTGFRDRALLGVLAYTFARIGPAVNLKVEDYYPSGKRFLLRFREKGGKENAAQLDYLELLGDLLDKYESRSGKVDKASSPLEILNYLAEENDITTRELGKILGIDHSVAARILKGERAITIEHAKSLGIRFKMDPKAFLEL